LELEKRLVNAQKSAVDAQGSQNNLSRRLQLWSLPFSVAGIYISIDPVYTKDLVFTYRPIQR
jgi:hypothetical protein